MHVLLLITLLNIVKKWEKDYSELNMIEYGTTFNCILNAPFGDVVYFRNAEYLKSLKDSRNYKWYSKIFEGKRMDIVFK